MQVTCCLQWWPSVASKLLSVLCCSVFSASFSLYLVSGADLTSIMQRPPCSMTQQHASCPQKTLEFGASLA